MPTMSPAPDGDNRSRAVIKFQLPTVINPNLELSARQAALNVISADVFHKRLSDEAIAAVVAEFLKLVADTNEGKIRHGAMEVLAACSPRNQAAMATTIYALENPHENEGLTAAAVAGLRDGPTVFYNKQVSYALGICIEQASPILAREVIGCILDRLKYVESSDEKANLKFEVGNQAALCQKLTVLDSSYRPRGVDDLRDFKMLLAAPLGVAACLRSLALDAALTRLMSNKLELDPSAQLLGRIPQLVNFLMDESVNPQDLFLELFLDRKQRVITYDPIDQLQGIDSLSRLVRELTVLATKLPGTLGVAVPLRNPGTNPLKSVLQVTDGVLDLYGGVENDDKYKSMVEEHVTRFVQAILAAPGLEIIWYGVPGDHEFGAEHNDLILTPQAAAIKKFLDANSNNKVIVIGGQYLSSDRSEGATLYSKLAEMEEGTISAICEMSASDWSSHQWFIGKFQIYSLLEETLAKVPDAAFEVGNSPFKNTKLANEPFSDLWHAAIFRSQREPPEDDNIAAAAPDPVAARPTSLVRT